MAVGVFTLLIIFVLAVVFAVLSGWLADRKGYSFPLFAFLGFFLGPITALIAAVMPSKKLAPADS
jgi:cytochrome c oxidase assembly factor CtaG